MKKKQRQLGILLADVLLLYGTLWLTLLLRTGEIPSSQSYLEHVAAFSLALPFWVVIFYTFGLYRLDTPFDDSRFASRLAGATALSTLMTALVYYLNYRAGVAPKTVLAIHSGAAFLAIMAWRYELGRAFRASQHKRVTVFIGLNSESRALIQEIRSKPFLGYAVGFAYDEEAEAAPEGVPLVSDPAALGEAIVASGADLVVIDDDDERLSDDVLKGLFALIGRGVRFERLPDFYEMLFRRIPIGAINDTWFLDNIDLREKRPYSVLKRALDVGLSSVILLATLWLWPFIALGIKLSSPGPVFFRQERLGKGEEPFTIVKFRTMRIEGNDFSPTGVRDPRIPAFCAFLRKTRLDELPQFINIIRGEMSFIGPRPERPDLAARLEEAVPYYRQRLLAKPGLSGWDQVSGEYHSPSIEDTYKKLQSDLYYIKNMSPSLDASIFFKTIATVFMRSGR